MRSIDSKPTRRARRGSNAIEFALLMPVFWLLFMAAVDYGWLFAYRSALHSSVNVACRSAALIDPGLAGGDMEYVYSVARTEMEALLAVPPVHGCDPETCLVEVYGFGDPPGRSLRCSVQSDFTPLVGITASAHVMSAGIVTRQEWQRW